MLWSSRITTDLIFHAHTLKGSQPTEKETKNFLLRAKYELDRVSEIREDLLHKWQQAGKYHGSKDEIIAHIIAERQASIEGRMYEEAKQAGLKPSANIPQLADQKFKAHRASTQALAQNLAAKHGLAESTARACAKDIQRYAEPHGEKPSTGQISAIVQIVRNFDKQGYDPAVGSHNIEYLRRRDSDFQLRERLSQGKDLSGFKDFPYREQPYREQNYAYASSLEKSYHEKAKDIAIEANSKSREMDLSM